MACKAATLVDCARVKVGSVGRWLLVRETVKVD